MSRSPTELNVTGIKTHTLAADGTKVSLGFATCYIGDLILTMPVECASELLAMLGPTIRTLALAGNLPDAAQSRPTAPAPGPTAPKAADKGQATIRITTPKKWMVTANTQIPGGFVLLLLIRRPRRRSATH